MHVTIQTTIVDPKGRYAITDITIDCSRLLLCNIYAPNVYSKGFFLHLLAKLYSLGDEPLILGGDFNIVSSPRSDRSSPRQCTRLPKIGIPYINRRLHLMDIWRTLHPLEIDYSCLSAAHGAFTRVDHILTSESLFTRILESSIEPICLSDHALCWVRIAHSIDRGPHKQWCFLSHFVTFREMMYMAWMSYTTDNAEHTTHSPLLFWQASKSVLRGQIPLLRI